MVGEKGMRSEYRAGPSARIAGLPSAMWVSLALILATSVCTLQAHAVTLEEAVRTALLGHPRIKGATAERRAAEREVRQARAGYYPSLDLRVALGSEHTDIEQLNKSGNAQGTMGKREEALIARQLLWDGFATRSRVDRRRALAAAAAGTLEDTREAIAFQAVKAYIEVLKNQRLVELAEENVLHHRDTLENVRLRVRGGIGQKADLEQARGRLALANSVLRARRGSLLQARAAYERVIGEAPVDLGDPPGEGSRELTRDGEFDEASLKERIARELEEAMRSHPAIQSAVARVRAAEAALHEARAAYHPRVTLEAAVTRDNNIAGVRGQRDTESLMVVANWNLFRGGADRANEQSLAERRARAVQDAADVRRRVRENVQQAVEAKATSEARLGYLREHVAASKETLKAYRAQFNLGRRTLLDLLNAQIELFNARSSLVVGEYEDLLNEYYIQASKGALVRSLGLAAK